MSLFSYLAVLPGLLSKKPKESQVTVGSRTNLMDANAAYQRAGTDFGRQAGDYRAKLQGAETDYLNYLKNPTGMDAEDQRLVGRTREGMAMNARRATARVANNPNVAASGAGAGAAIGIENQRLGGEAQLQAAITSQALQRKAQNKQAIVNYLASRMGQNQSAMFSALGGQAGTAGVLLSNGTTIDAQKRQDANASNAGLSNLLSYLGMLGA